MHGSVSRPVQGLGNTSCKAGLKPLIAMHGLHPNQILDPDQPYIRYLQELGYDSDNPWHDFANSAEGPDGEILSGWEMRHAGRRGTSSRRTL